MIGDNDAIHAEDKITFTTISDAELEIHYTADISLKGWKSVFNCFIGGKLQTLATDAENGLKAALAKNLHLEPVHDMAIAK